MPAARCLALVQLLLIGCATEPVQIEPPPLPRPPDGAVVECPEGLPKATDGTIQSILDTRAASARRYAECRERHRALKGHIEDVRSGRPD